VFSCSCLYSEQSPFSLFVVKKLYISELKHEIKETYHDSLNYYIVTCRPVVQARNNRTGVARGVPYVGSHISSVRQRMFSVLWSDPRLYNVEKIIIDSLVRS
jgi:hypothetical protein